MTLRAWGRMTGTAALVMCLATPPVWAERMMRFGNFEAHYSLVPTTLLKPVVASRYDIVRGRDRALLNVSVLEGGERAVRAHVTGVVRDLMGQVREITFREVVEGEAVYYLSEIRHDDQEVLRFSIALRTPDGRQHELAFQQKMYWEHG